MKEEQPEIQLTGLNVPRTTDRHTFMANEVAKSSIEILRLMQTNQTKIESYYCHIFS